MLSSKIGLSIADEKKYVAVLFFLFAAQIMSWVPRFPEVKANLGISNGEFGTYVSFGSIGSIVALIITGHLVHKYGAKVVLIFAATGMCLTASIIVHLNSASIFIILQIFNGAVISAFNVAVNAQAFHAQDRAGVMIMSRQHGFWTAGAVSTAVLSGILVSFVGISLHINVLSAILLIAILIYIKKLDPEIINPSRTEEDNFRFTDIFTSF
jgi:MFS family permease